MSRSTGRILLVVVAAVVSASALSAPSAGAAPAGCPKGARCATVTVPLDHTGAIPGTLGLAYAELPATGTSRGTLVILSGGPGQAAVPLTRPVGRLLAPLRASYDMVFVDQRGTGRSGAVACRLAKPADVPACAARLGARRAVYSTAETARDLEDLRVALGAPKLTLLGVSYGTKVAGEYARRYPATTAALVLDSPVPVDGLDAPERLAQLAAPRVLREVCAGGPCRATIRDAAAELARAARRLQRAPLRGRQVSPNGRVRERRVGEAVLYGLLRRSDEDPLLRAQLPAAIASAARGDGTPLVRLAAGAGGGEPADEGINEARFLATSCLEGRLPWSPDAPLETRGDALDRYVAETGAAFAPFRPATVLRTSATALCAAWPVTARPEWIPPTPGPDVPVLVLGGREDLRTPLEDARRTAGQYPNAVVLPIPRVGHSTLTSDVSGCALAGTVAFLAGRPFAHCPRGDRLTLPAAPYIPARLRALRPTCHATGLPGRTCSAVALTFTGLVYDLQWAPPALLRLKAESVRLPGLRGGYSTLSKAGLAFHDYEWIRGVTVSGRIGEDAATLVVGGAAAARGTVRLDKRGLVGVLGGRRVRGARNPLAALRSRRLGPGSPAVA